ncbi:putative TMhelix containing protein [Vibrio phage 236O40-1]|nr:putative TMhelix containing protein [Vibrio phage 236O40-1]
MKYSIGLFFLILTIGCTFNVQIENESASGRDGGITEQSQADETTTPTIDAKADVNGV